MRRMAPRLSDEELQELWARRQAGAWASELGPAFGRDQSTVRYLLTVRGGIAPPRRRRAPQTLSRAEREEISRGIAAGDSLRGIGHRLGRAASTISREIRRHGGRRRYRAAEADGRAWRRAR